MEETYRIKAIILNRKPFRESDLSVTVYSFERGKQALVARGAKKFRSKVAAHLEPLCLSEIMVVRGRQFDYVGSAISDNCFIKIKENLEKLEAAGKAVFWLNKLIKEEESDIKIFELIKEYFDVLEQVDLKLESKLFANFFALKLLSRLGYKPELYQCVKCGQKITPGNNYINILKSCLACKQCASGKNLLTISDDCIKILRVILDKKFVILNNIKANKSLNEEVQRVIDALLANHL